jgi:hypothetical protein
VGDSGVSGRPCPAMKLVRLRTQCEEIACLRMHVVAADRLGGKSTSERADHADVDLAQVRAPSDAACKGGYVILSSFPATEGKLLSTPSTRKATVGTAP